MPPTRIGAAGICCPPTAPIVQAEIELPADWDPALTQVWFDPRETRYFYWLIPESRERGVVGLVGDRPETTRRLLDSFLARHGFRPLAYQAAQVAMHHPRLRPWGRLGSTPVLLIGDAAGQVKVTTVGGTVTGLWGAQAAARAVLRGTSYRRELLPLTRELNLHWLIRQLLERLDGAGYNSLLNAVSPKTQSLLARYSRDQMAQVFWQLPFLEPRLLVLGLRLFWRWLFAPKAARAPLSALARLIR